MKEIFIGIDYSLKSPAICIIKDNQYKWLSHPVPVDKKAELENQQRVSKLKDVQLIFKKDNELSKDYSDYEWEKIRNYIKQAKAVIELIYNSFTKEEIKKCTFHIGFEGYSFSSGSNNIIDIVGATTCLKTLIIEGNYFPSYTISIFSPKNIKKHAGYGMYDKVDLFDVFTGNYDYIKVKYEKALNPTKKKKVSSLVLNYTDENLCGDFVSYCKNLSINRDVKKPKILKPIDDLIDSYFVARCLREKILR